MFRIPQRIGLPAKNQASNPGGSGDNCNHTGRKRLNPYALRVDGLDAVTVRWSYDPCPMLFSPFSEQKSSLYPKIIPMAGFWQAFSGTMDTGQGLHGVPPFAPK